MEDLNQNLLNEKVSDETIKQVYTDALRKKGVSVKKIEIEHNSQELADYFHIAVPFGIHYWIKWPLNISVAYIMNTFNDEKKSLEDIKNPNVDSVTDSIAFDYKQLMKRQNILKQLLSLILEGSRNNNISK